MRGRGFNPRARSLSPIPASAGDANVITPNNFSGFGRLGRGFTGLHRQKWFSAKGAHKVGRANIGLGIFAAYRNGKSQAYGIVEVNNRVDAWKNTIPRGAL
jgi:hypothetical protein